MSPKKITKADACHISGYTRDEMSYVLREIPPYASQKTVARVPREFAPLDLLVLSVVYLLDKSGGMRLPAIAEVSMPIRNALAVPRTPNASAGLVISTEPPTAEYVELPVPVSSGTVVPLASIFERVDHFCEAFRIRVKENQKNLVGLGPGLVKTRGTKRNSKTIPSPRQSAKAKGVSRC